MPPVGFRRALARPRSMKVRSTATLAMHRLPTVPSDQRKPTVCTVEQGAPVGLSPDSSHRPSSPPRSERRNPRSDRHQHQSAASAADIALDRDPCRVVAMQPNPKPQRPGGSTRHAHTGSRAWGRGACLGSNGPRRGISGGWADRHSGGGRRRTSHRGRPVQRGHRRQRVIESWRGLRAMVSPSAVTVRQPSPG